MSYRTWADRILDRALPRGPTGESIRGDLHQERTRRVEAYGEAAASRWYLRQALGIWLFATADGLRGRRWHSGRAMHDLSVGGGIGPLRDGLRVLRRAPGYSATVVVTLAVAMAATVSVFTVVRGVLLRDLPYPDPAALVRIDALREGEPADGGLDYPTFLDWRDGLESVGALAAYHLSEGVYVTPEIAEVWQGASTTPEFFTVLGVPPMIGTFFAPGEGEAGDQSIFLAAQVWERRFGSDPRIVGQSIDFYEQTWTVRGVMPRGFAFPNADIDYWIPLRLPTWLNNRGAGFLHAVGRLSEGVSVAALSDELASLSAALKEIHGEEIRPVTARSLAEVDRARVRRVLWVFMGAVGFFLLAACANVAGLALARTEARLKELSVRLALGASRGRLAVQVLAESTALSLCGGALGLGGAVLGVRALLSLAPPDLPRREAIVIDPVVVLFAFAVAVVAGIVFGVLPGLRGARIAGARPDASRTISRGTRRTHNLLAGAQLALAVVLLSGSGMLLRSFSALNRVETGFVDPGRILIVEVGLGRGNYATPEDVLQFHQLLLEGLSGIPSVESVGLSTHPPFSNAIINASVTREGETFRRGGAPLLGLEATNGAYRAALGLPLLRGRDVASAVADATHGREVVINESAAHLLWPGQVALGKRFSFDVDEGRVSPDESNYTVVGIVPDVMDGGLDHDARPRAYYDLATLLRQYSFISGRFFYAALRTNGDPYAVVDHVRRVVQALDPTAPLRSITSLEESIRETTLPARFRTFTLTIFAVLAVVVAMLGVYGVMAYGVAVGTREIGVRMALGAEASSVRSQVLKRAAMVVALGGTAGMAAAAALGPVLRSMLFGVSDRDPITFVSVLVLSAVGALAAAYVPALRASRVEPVRVLQQE